MSNMFLRRLLGNNEYRFRLKTRAEEICRQDIGRAPIGNPNFTFPIAEKDLAFLKLKAPVVLFILDRRMTKTDRSLGLSRVLPKLFLQSMSGDLNSCLSTVHFIKLCERVSHNRLEQFFDQWVFGSGYPIFRVTQRFNKKRMIVEMGIRQVQATELDSEKVDAGTFLDDASKSVDRDKDVSSGADGANGFGNDIGTGLGGVAPGFGGIGGIANGLGGNTGVVGGVGGGGMGGPGANGVYPIQPIFTGPMTIRIHEADGTPYEHVVDLKDSFTKLDIQYNTKYKRLRRNQRGTTNTSAKSQHDVIDFNAIQDDDENPGSGVLLHCLGDVLQSDKDMQEWRLSDWGKDEEERMYNEAFEWMRVDSDFEWICKIYINQPDYMYVSQLQQDRDVIAQCEAVSFFRDLKPSKLYSTFLVRTLMDRRYYYGIRVQAALALVKMAVEEVDYIGKYHLLKAFQELFCFEGSNIPAANNFSDFPTYFVQKALLRALSQVTDSRGNSPIDVQRFLLDVLRYNENSTNPFSDCFYVSELIGAIVDSIKGGDNRVGSRRPRSDPESKQLLKQAVAEIERCERMDRWIPSFQNMITVKVINEKRRLAWHGLINVNPAELIHYTRPGNNPDVRLAAFKSLMSLGGLKMGSIVEYLVYVIIHEPSARVQNGLIDLIGQVISEIAVNGEAKNTIDGTDSSKQIESATEAEEEAGGLTIVESGVLSARKDALARTTLTGAIEMLRKTFEPSKDTTTNTKPANQDGQSNAFANGIWQLLLSTDVASILEKKRLLQICSVLYESLNSYIVSLPIPRASRLVAKRVGDSQIVIKREDRHKPKKIVLATGSGSATPHVQASTTPSAAASSPSITTPSTAITVNGGGNTSSHVPAVTAIKPTPTTTAPPVVKRQYKKKSLASSDSSVSATGPLASSDATPSTAPAVITKPKSEIIKLGLSKPGRPVTSSTKTSKNGQSVIFKFKIPPHATQLQAAAASAAMPYVPITNLEPATQNGHNPPASKPTKPKVTIKFKM
ncbi:Taf2p [Sugiyamaella lignohabitans]|uniref:Taf2p n=1 Tax=Sugiyamaella lignohabitans TaxID=796027 RepID=A0A167EIT4_9ASCO|nr:Taf2p [Sugiyamaella lignohabitans]ANB14131.1 Taf2p [Sugiyamaella lignohabitans]